MRRLKTLRERIELRLAEIAAMTYSCVYGLYRRSGFTGAARQALTKLGVAWEVSDYHAGRSTQVLVNLLCAFTASRNWC